VNEAHYELLEDDPRFKLKKGDVLICSPMHPAWASDKLEVIRRVSDGYDPGCSVYRSMVKRLPEPFPDSPAPDAAAPAPDIRKLWETLKKSGSERMVLKFFKKEGDATPFRALVFVEGEAAVDELLTRIGEKEES